MKLSIQAILTAALVALSGFAQAHSGTDSGAHHDLHLVLAILTSLALAIGFKRIWVAPIAFVGTLVVAALLGTPI